MNTENKTRISFPCQVFQIEKGVIMLGIRSADGGHTYQHITCPQLIAAVRALGVPDVAGKKNIRLILEADSE